MKIYDNNILKLFLNGILISVPTNIYANNLVDCSALATPKTYYVSPTGNNNNPGSIDAPFLTIQTAANIARPGDIVMLREGVYRETVKPACSGTEGSPITFTNYPKEIAEVNGTDIISGWSLFKGKIYKASLNTDLGIGNNQIFVNKHPLIEAQWPQPTCADFEDINYPQARLVLESGSQPVFVETVGSKNMFSTASVDTHLTLPPLTNNEAWNQAQIHVQARYNSAYMYGKITQIDGTNLTYTIAGSGTDPKASYQQKMFALGGEKYYLTGLLSFLTAKGEWFVDSAKKQLYIRTRTDENPDRFTIEAKARNFGFDLSARSYITLKGLKFFATGVNMNYSENYPASRNNTLDNLNATYVSHNIANDIIWSAYNSGIVLSGYNNTLKNSIISYAGVSAVSVVNGSNIIIDNNVISNVNYDVGTVDGGISMIARDSRISNNTISSSGYALIYILSVSNTKIINNLIYNGLLQLKDGGNIYTSGADGQGTQIANNIVYNDVPNPQAAGIYLDNDSRNFVINHNIVFNSLAGIIISAPNNSANNSINTKIYNNTVDSGCTNCRALYSYTALATSILTGVEVKNNVFNGEVYMNRNMASPANLRPIYQNNLFASKMSSTTKDYLLTSCNYGNILSTDNAIDPQYVSPFPNEELNYGLKATSPAISLSQFLPKFLNIGVYTIPFMGVAQGIPAGACTGNAWTAGATLTDYSALSLCS